MPIALPQAIADYFAADRGTAEATARCFTDTAVVVDERAAHVGREAIRRWKAQARAKYSYTSEPVAVTQEDGRIVVTGRVTGSFPGSPVDLRYAFTLEGGAIARLEITA